MTFFRSHPAAGFTLIEMVIAITITGIVAAMVAVFIRAPVEGYVDSVRRAELTDQADVTLRRIARDIRLALPNSLRVTSAGGVNYIEFIMTRGGGRHRADSDGSTGGDSLSFTSAADTSFHVLGKSSNNPAGLDFISAAPADYVVAYNLGPGNEPANAYNYDAGTGACLAGGCNIARVTAVSCAASPCTVTLAANPFAAQTPPLPSPTARFQVLPGDVQAVTYACPTAAAGNVVRFWNYGFSAAQPTAFGAGNAAPLAGNATCVVDYAATATGRNGLLYINLTLASGGESVALFQQIHVDNSP